MTHNIPNNRGADLVIDECIRNGIDTAFGIPGIQIMSLFDAIYNKKERIELVHTRHEQSLSFMAMGYSRIARKPALVLVVPGPGIFNALSGIATAFACNIPMVVLAGQIPIDSIGQHRGQLHEVNDQFDCLKGITKAQKRVLSIEDIPKTITEAIALSQSGICGPVVVDIPPEILNQEFSIRPEFTPKVHKTQEGISEETIDFVVNKLANSKRPSIIVGGGAVRSGCSEELRELTDIINPAILPTQNGKGLVPDSDHRVLGVTYFANLGPGYDALPESDVVLALGTRLFIRNHSFKSEQSVINVNLDKKALKNSDFAISIESDCKTFLKRVLEKIRNVPLLQNADSKRLNKYKEHKTQFREKISSIEPSIISCISAIREQLKKDTVFVSGMTAIGYWSHLALEIDSPDYYITPGYMGTLGFSFPTALGAKMACPNQRVVSICGDGGFMFSEPELSTAVQNKIKILILLFNNSSFGASEWDQEHLFGRRKHGTQLTNPDFRQLANAYSIPYYFCKSNDIGNGISDALSSLDDSTVLLEVSIPHCTPPFRHAYVK